MLESLQQIKNPLTRSITGASAVFSILTMVFALIIGMSGLKESKENHKFAVYGSLIGAIAGAVIGGATCYKPSQKKAATKTITESIDRDKSWKDWRNFVVDHKVKESQEITSFYLKPQDKFELPDFKPGQFLTIKLDIPEQTRPVIRTYSLSDYNNTDGYYRLSIKKEGAPRDLDVPPGIASNFLHDVIEEGSIIPAKPPNGKFFIDVPSSVPAVLISNGVGITPMIAMAKACTKLNPHRHLWFLHGARNGDYHAFRDAILALGQENPNLHIHYKYSRPRPEDAGFYHSEGYVDKELLETQIIPEIQQIYGASNAEYFLCGSPAFMDSIRSGLGELGVVEDKVFFESFSKGGKTKGNTQPKTTNTEGIDNAEIVFAASGKTLTWQKGNGTILEFAEENGINPPYSCREGICLTCMSELQEGEVEYVEPPTNEPDEGSVLICICQPKTNKVVLNL
ncbi:Oxidoreductase [Hyella patelloides LEGE 07179]|uniref:Oxidoreductase n=1 Tax=Hyella patelloides LEGE 07179 TaxID=945734 RepID=A0A563VY24_9CYAN|nr:2Fe-2S iron-sulfur cluster-binding protein [Hyella patelloides]VEP16287.1 Oxidoreductase [Hyella patelloides LEGE 07179]